MAISCSIVEFFKRTESLPDPNGQRQQKEPKLKGTYVKLSDELKAEIARYALQNGNNVAVKYYSKKLEKPIKESSVRTWIRKYKSEYQKKRKA